MKETRINALMIFPKARLNLVREKISEANKELVELFGDLNAVMNQLDKIGKGKSKEYDYANYLYNGVGNALTELGKVQLLVDACYFKQGVRLDYLVTLSDESDQATTEPTEEA